MELVRTYPQIRRNLDYLESSGIYESRNHKDLVKRGTCFVTYDGKAGVSFAPSRFLGYVDNDFQKHAANHEKNGRDTNPAISAILHLEPKPNSELELAYQAYCRRLGFVPNAAGAFDVQRKYWDLRKSN